MTDNAHSDKGSRRCSVFLTPAPEDFHRLEQMIARLSSELGCPPFEPHVTIYSGRFSAPDLLVDCVGQAVEGESPLTLGVEGIGCSADYFKSLFIQLEEHPELRRIHEQVKAGCGNPSAYRFFPHLSLLYAEIPLAAKESLARRTTIDCRGILFDRVKVVTPLNRDEGWRDTMQWSTLRHWRLARSPL